MQDIDIDIVRAMHQNARFFRDGETNYVEISFVGSKDTLVKKVNPDLMAKFNPEWTAYCDGRPLEKRKGTPLTEVKGVDDLKAQQYITMNVHTAEELAALNDGQCQALGHGTITARREARALLELRAGQFAQTQMDRISKATEKLTNAPAAPPPELEAMKEQIGELQKAIGDMAGLLRTIAERPKPGRPKKESAQ